jgi:hypothetical protein
MFLLSRFWTSSGVRIDQLQQLVVLGFRFHFCTFPHSLRDAMAEMIAHQRLADSTQRLLYRGQLSEYVGAVAVFLDHALQAANLAFDTPQPVKIRQFDLGIDARGFLGA